MRTPGPYRYTIQPKYLNGSIYGKNGQLVAEVWSGNACTIETVEANARLLANAERLRDALALCYSALTEEGITDRQRKVAIRDAAKILDYTAE
jgi:hypothetical protein